MSQTAPDEPCGYVLISLFTNVTMHVLIFQATCTKTSYSYKNVKLQAEIDNVPSSSLGVCVCVCVTLHCGLSWSEIG